MIHQHSRTHITTNTTARLVPIVPTIIALCSRLYFFFYNTFFQSCFFGSSSSVSLHQVTLSSLSEQQAGALQQRALNLLRDTQPSFLDGLMNIYQLNTLDPAILRLHIVRLQAQNCYKEVSASFGVFAKVRLIEKEKIFCFDLNFVFFAGSRAQHKAETTERPEYGGGVTKHFQQTCLYNLCACLFISSECTA